LRGWRIDERQAFCVRKEDGKVGDDLGILWRYRKSDITYDQPLPRRDVAGQKQAMQARRPRDKGRWLTSLGFTCSTAGYDKTSDQKCML
jgi:hypothetical protein